VDWAYGEIAKIKGVKACFERQENKYFKERFEKDASNLNRPNKRRRVEEDGTSSPMGLDQAISIVENHGLLVTVDVFSKSNAIDKCGTGRKALKAATLEIYDNKDAFTGEDVNEHTSIASHIIPCATIIAAAQEQKGLKKRNEKKKSRKAKNKSAKVLASEKEIPDTTLQEISSDDKICPYNPKTCLLLNKKNNKFFDEFSVTVDENGIIKVSEEAKMQGCDIPDGLKVRLPADNKSTIEGTWSGKKEDYCPPKSFFTWHREVAEEAYEFS